MERTLSPEEKIRRAEEIYNRRRNSQYPRTRVATVNVAEPKSFGLFKKMILQIAICLVIYFIFYLIQNGNYLFSEDLLNKAKEVLSYDINIPSLYSQAVQYVNEQMKGLVPQDEKKEPENGVVSNTTAENSITNTIEDGIGGADLNNVVMENTPVAGVQTQEPNQPELPQTDDEYIKSNFSFIKPINGMVSSEFGLRDSSNPIVSHNHTGIDIAANTGTVIKAAMAGTVTVSSTIGDYGYHIKIVNEDITTLYGHCSKLYVKQGDVIEQGQEIAEVGSTGKSTGPHLHFEIIRGSTYINPRNILDF